MLEEILRSKILQSGKLNIEELDKIHYVQKHNKKCPVVFMNEPFENCTELLYD
jgi:hypothetical protein